MLCSARLKRTATSTPQSWHAAASTTLSQPSRQPVAVLQCQRRSGSMATDAHPCSSNSSINRHMRLPIRQVRMHHPAPSRKSSTTAAGHSTWALQCSSTTASTSATPISRVTVTTYEELAAAVKAKRKHPRPLTIDLGGQTLVCQEEGQILKVGGEKKHIIVTNGSLLLPADCGFKVERGAKLELIGLNMTAMGPGAETSLRKGGLRPIVSAVSKGCQLVLDGCSITWKKSASDPREDIAPAAVFVRNGARAEVRRCWFEGMKCGVHVRDCGSEARLDSTVSTKCHRNGFLAGNGARLHAHRCSAFRNDWSGFFGHSPSTLVHVVHCRSDRNADGFYVHLGAELIAEGCAADANHRCGYCEGFDRARRIWRPLKKENYTDCLENGRPLNYSSWPPGY